MKTINKEPLKKKDLIQLEDMKPILKEFKTILRKHGISNNSRGYDVLMNLILCKIIDEENIKDDDDIPQFQIIEDEDLETMMSRIVELYEKAMLKYMDIDINWYLKK